MDERGTAIRRVMKTVARRAVVAPLPIQADDGTRPVVVALPDDTLKGVVERIMEFGGRANVFVAYPDDLALVELSVGAHEDSHDDEGNDLAHAATTMSMYVDVLFAAGGPVSIDLNVSDSAFAQSVQKLTYAF